MTPKKITSRKGPAAVKLPQQAEAMLSKKKDKTQPLTKADALRTVQELQVHQIELEMQNEELVQARAEIEGAYRKYTDLYDFAPVGYFTLAGDGKILETNLAGGNLLGMERAKLINRRLGQFVSVESRPLFNVFFEKLLSNEGKETCELIFEKKGGGVFCARLEATCFEGSQECRAVLLDITERKQAEEALEEQKQKLAYILRGTNAGTWEWNVQTGEAIFNERWAEMIGYTLKEISPVSIDTWRKFAHPEDLQKSNELLQKHFTGKLEYYECEVRMRRKSGDWIWVLDRGKVATWAEDAKPLLMCGTHQDITERKQAEALIRHYTNELERRVKERTVDLIIANRAKDEFMANVSHELRTPLSSVLGYSDLLLEGVRGPMSENQEQAVQMIRTSGKHLLGLINDILDVSMIESGKLDIRPRIICVNEICQSSLTFIKELADRKSIAVEYSPSLAYPSIYADPTRLKQILINLLDNALKFTPEKGSVKLEVQESHVEGLIRFSITDTGVGIKPENLQKIFKPFVQADASLSRQYEGAGLGLALAKKLAELHRGQIEAHSEFGKGSCFTVILPWDQKTVENKK